MANFGAPPLVVAMIFLFIIVINSPRGSQAEISCSTVADKLFSCENYIRNGVPVPTLASPCCQGVTYLMDAAKTTADRQSVCRCLNLINSFFTDDQINKNAAKLPGICHAYIPYTIKPNMDCSSVK